MEIFYFPCRLLQVEHRTTELRAEEIERRVGSETSSLDEMSVTSSTAASEHSLVRSEDRSNRFSGDNYNRRKVCSAIYLYFLQF